jgi:hypothetical protein
MSTFEGMPVAPFILLVALVVIFWLAGLAGVAAFRNPSFILRAALGVMFSFTASAHWAKKAS